MEKKAIKITMKQQMDGWKIGEMNGRCDWQTNGDLCVCVCAVVSKVYTNNTISSVFFSKKKKSKILKLDKEISEI